MACNINFNKRPAARRVGNISIPGSAAANYTFSMDNDDGALLYIDGQLLVSHGGMALSCSLRACVHTTTMQVTGGIIAHGVCSSWIMPACPITAFEHV